MIKSEKGETKIVGSRYDLILEFVLLYKHVIKVMPEIVTSTVLAYDDELLSAYRNCPTEHCMAMDILVKQAKEIVDNGHHDN